MAKFKREKAFQDLRKYRVLVEDTDPSSRYFQIRNAPDIFHAGKNSLVVAGSENLVDETEILVEILDENGDTVFNQPIRNYAEGRARIVSVEIYEDTPPGPGLIVLLGRLATTADGSPIPDQWKDSYNVRWQKRITIDPGTTNNTKIRLYKTPTLDVNEVLFTWRKSLTGSLSLVPASNTSSLAITRKNKDDPSTMRISMIGSPPSFVSASFVGGSFTGIMPADACRDSGLIFSASIVGVFNDKTIIVDTPITSSGGKFCNTIFNDYTMSFQEKTTFSATTLTRSFANTSLNNLRTFSGQVARTKLFYRSVDQEQDFEYLADQLLGEQELTITQSGMRGPNIPIGLINSQSVIDDFWTIGDIQVEPVNNFPTNPAYIVNSSHSLTINHSRLINSVHPTTPDLSVSASAYPLIYFGFIDPLIFLENSEYELKFDALCFKHSSASAKMEVYLTGSAIPSQTNPLGTLLGTYEIPAEVTSLSTSTVSALLAKNNVIFETPRSGSGYLNFVVYGGDWHLSDVKIVSAIERGFSPDFANLLSPVVGRRFENLEFKAQLFDPDNNQYPEEVFSPIVTFDGGNLLLRGTDHRVEGTLTVAPSGSGVTITAAGWQDEDGTEMSGSAIFMGAGRFFDKDTAILLAEEVDGDPRFSIGDKLKAYIDDTTGEFILLVNGTILIGSGSDARDFRSFLPPAISDDFFHRGRGVDLDFHDLIGRKSMTVGKVDSVGAGPFGNTTQIVRMGSYSRGTTAQVVAADSPLIISPVTASINPHAATTTSSSLATSGTIYVSPGTVVYNNVLYANLAVGLEETAIDVLQDNPYNVNIELIADVSWVGFESGSNPGETYAPDFSGTRVRQTVAVNKELWITTSGTFDPAPYSTYPIHIPEDQPDGYNTLYIVTRLEVHTEHL